MLVLVLTLAVIWPIWSLAAPLAPDAVPEPLAPWVDWVLHGHDERHCPHHYDGDTRACVWPGVLEIQASATGARFQQSLSVYRRSEVQLPGDNRYWPRHVLSGDQPLVVIERAGAPYVLLDPGRHALTGELEWPALPASLKIAPRTGIVRYVLDGEAVALPRIQDGGLWLRDGTAVTKTRAPEDRLSMEVYRLVEDGHPGQLVTHLAIEVSGQQRELVLGKPVLPGFLPMEVESALPARLEPDGALRVQVRPGRWVLRVLARPRAAMRRLERPTEGLPPPWPASEVWAYRAAPRDRLTEITGVRQIDPRQVRLPGDWRDLPAYEVASGAAFEIRTIRRGDPDPEPDNLTLARDLWLDFDGQGYTVRDRITGRMTSGWRLSVDQAFALGRVTIAGQPRLITRLAEGRRDGVEVRRGRLDLVAESRLRDAGHDLPAVGWGRDFQQVSAQLHLPPGYRLLAVTGVDRASTSWMQGWTLYDVFLVLIIALAAGRLWGWPWTAVALVTVGLAWHEPGAPRLIWLFLLAVIALLRVVPAAGRLAALLKGARLIGLITLVVTLLPFVVQQAREGLYPQLEPQGAMLASSASAPPASAPVGDAAGWGQADDELAPQEALPAAGEGRLYEGVLDAVRAKSGQASPALRQPRSSPYKAALDQIDPTATVQTGPGLPDWRWHTARLDWSGPVAADQHIEIHLIGPATQRLLCFMLIGLLLLLTWRILDLRHQASRWRLGLLLVALSVGGLGSAGAADFPPPELLRQLEQRLLEPKTPAPRAAIPSMTLDVTPDRGHITLDVQALDRTAIPLPVDTSLAMPVRVRVDEALVSDRLFRTAGNGLWLLVPEGRHQVELEVRLPPVEQLQIPLPLRPKRIRTRAAGWTIDGIDQDGRIQGQLSLVRIREDKAATGAELSPTTLPAFLRVERTLRLGLQWEAITRVTRLSPLGTPVSVKVPVVPGASVVTDGVTVRQDQVLVNLAANQREFQWRARLSPVARLTLTAAPSTTWLETWRADIGPIWHVSIDGIPPIHHQDDKRNWLPAWHPWPGEQVSLQIERPRGVIGSTKTLDQSHLEVKPGKRTSDASLSFRLRASQGGRHALLLPEGAELQSVKVDGKTQPIRQEGRRVDLPVVPGEQSYELSWRERRGIETLWRSPGVGLGDASVNARLRVHVPRDRWTLWLSGPRLGPTVLFWSVLPILVLSAAILTRLGARRLPIGFLTWLLLGLGLTQLSSYALAVVAIWFFALHYRATRKVETRQEKIRLNALQIGIVMLTIATAAVLLGAVQQGLLGQPTMLIEGNGSSTYVLNWYQDRVTGDHPRALLVSAPLWVYRLIMMAWALWLAFSVLGWIRWGWQAFAAGGLWQRAGPRPRKTAAAPASG